LTGAGFSEEDTKHLIGSAIVAEMRNVLKTSKPFDAERYRKLLDKLPELTKEQP
jgi:cytochrome c556